MSDETKVAVSEEMEKFVSYIEKLTVLELSQLVKALEQRLGVSAAAPMAVAAAAAPGAAGAGAPAAEEKTDFEVVLVAGGEKKISVIKVVREITGLGLKEAKDLVTEAPKTVKESVPKEEAQKMKAKLEEVGATVELK
jgi:large subunit ribosomal protein L7/L12